jgi:hypothetical protein
MIRTVIPRAILAIVAAARAVSVWGVRVGGVGVRGVQVAMVRSKRRRRAVGLRRRGGVQAWVGVLHVEGEVIGLRAGESGRAVDGEEFFEEAVAFAAFDVAAATAGVGVSVERHLRFGGSLWLEWYFVAGGVG